MIPDSNEADYPPLVIPREQIIFDAQTGRGVDPSREPLGIERSGELPRGSNAEPQIGHLLNVAIARVVNAQGGALRKSPSPEQRDSEGMQDREAMKSRQSARSQSASLHRCVPGEHREQDRRGRAGGVTRDVGDESLERV